MASFKKIKINQNFFKKNKRKNPFYDLRSRVKYGLRAGGTLGFVVDCNSFPLLVAEENKFADFSFGGCFFSLLPFDVALESPPVEYVLPLLPASSISMSLVPSTGLSNLCFLGNLWLRLKEFLLGPFDSGVERFLETVRRISGVEEQMVGPGLASVCKFEN